MKEKNFLGIEDIYAHYDDAFFDIIPVPYERTTSYGKGTSGAPAAIIEASRFVELYDEQFRVEAYKKGIATEEPIDIEGNTETVFDRITTKTSEVLDNGKFPVSIGGEHSITLPIYRAFISKFENISILQFDAHSDLRESYEGSIYSHASVMHRIAELGSSITQVGVRSQCIEEAEIIREKKINTFYAHEIKNNGFNLSIIDTLDQNVYITFDLDYFDPAVMPSTGTPEPGGFNWYETIKFLVHVFEQRNIVGIDVVELAPQKDLAHPDFLAAKLIYKMMGLKIA